MSDELGTPPAAPVPADVEEHGAIARAALIVLGTVFALGGAVLTPVMLLSLWTFRAEWPLARLALGLPSLLLAAAICVYGVNLVRRGVRGRSRIATASLEARADRWYRRHVYAVGVLSSGFLVGVAMDAWGGPREFLLHGSGPSRIPWYLLLVFAVAPVHAALHEVGHAVAGALVGFRFTSLRVGSLVLQREGGRLRVSWSRLNLPDVLGLQVSAPVDEEALLGYRRAVHAGAGPLTTLALAASCCAAAQALDPTRSVTSALVADLSWTGCWFGAFLGVLNLLPLRLRGGLVTDGAHVVGALQPVTPAMRLLARTGTMTAQGRRPRDWGLSWAALLGGAESDPRSRDELLLSALRVAIDTDDSAGVSAVLDSVDRTALRNSLVWHEFELQAVMILAFQGKAAAARRRLLAIGAHPLVAAYPKLAESVVLLAEGDAGAARTALETWTKALEESGLGLRLRVGNEWAEEVLRAQFDEGSEKRGSVSTTSP